MKAIRNKPETVRQAIKAAKKLFKEEHGKQVYKPIISVRPRWAGGRYVLVISSGPSSEYYF